MGDELRGLLRDKAEEMRLPPDIPAAVLRRGRRRRVMNGTLAGALAAGMVALAVVAVRVAGEPRAFTPNTVLPSPSPSLPPSVGPTPSIGPTVSPTVISPTPTGASPTPSDLPPAGDFPETFVGLLPLEGDPQVQIVQVDTATGEVVRTILDPIDTSEGIGRFVFAPDGRTLFYEQGTSACTSEIVRVPIDGGSGVVLAQGGGPALSPDGALLAYFDTYYECDPDHHLVVRDLVTGDEVRWSLRFGDQPPAGFYGVCRLGWLPDSRRLAFNLCQWLGDVLLHDLHVLDMALDQGIPLEEAMRLSPEGDDWDLAGFHAQTGGLAVRAASGCTDLGGVCRQPQGLISVDPDTGAQLATLLNPAPETWSIWFDGSGRSAIWVTPNGEVVGWNDSGAPVVMAEGYSAAYW